MKNSECIIYFTTKHGKVQSFRKGKKGWEQTSSRGIVRSCTAEQVLSHLLPYLAYTDHYRSLGLTLTVKRIEVTAE